jgi:hypothetical protein
VLATGAGTLHHFLRAPAGRWLSMYGGRMILAFALLAAVLSRCAQSRSQGGRKPDTYGGSTISMRRRPASLARWAVCWGRGQASQARVTDGRGVASLLVPRAARRRLAVSLDRSYGATAPDQPAGRRRRPPRLVCPSPGWHEQMDLPAALAS